MSLFSLIVPKIKGLFAQPVEPQDEAQLNEMRKKKYKEFLSEDGDLFFDVGANMGNRISPLLDLNIRIVAIEPQIDCINHLHKTFGDQITVVPKGLGSCEEEREMYIADESTISSFSKEWIESTQKSGRFRRNKWNKSVSIQITTLDKLIEEHGRPKFIKIDVEGFEFQVLKGLSQPVPFISFEYTVPERTLAVVQCVERIIEIAGGRQVLFNYSVGESMEFVFPEWVDENKILDEISSKRFEKTLFGDIYVKTQL